jgi:acetate kinase
MAHRRGSGGDPSRAILTINCGSSSVKFALYFVTRNYAAANQETLAYSGVVERIGLPEGRLSITDGTGAPISQRRIDVRDHAEALHEALDALESQSDAQRLDAIGHRVVHGGARYHQPQRVTDEVLAELHRLAPLAPLHLPAEIATLDALRMRYPSVPQVACFDTAFHHTMPRVARLFGLPRHLLDEGIVRYGFHGLSYEYIVGELKREATAEGDSLMGQRIVIAHLGNGASMAATRDGKSIDTTMGLTPLGGLVMSTRSGDLDPGVLLHLLEERHMSPADLRASVESAGGLLGVSGRSSDMRDLLAQADKDASAAEAVALFCYTASKHLGGLVASLGGIDSLVFTAGIGEYAPEVRRRICAPLAFLGIAIDATRNAANETVISTRNSPVPVRVIHTNEALMVARHTARVLAKSGTKRAAQGHGT